MGFPEAGTGIRSSGGRGDRPQVKLARYEIVRELGKGAMGIVYLAKDPLIGRLVALKTIRGSAQGDEDEAREFQQRFIREAQAAGILNHPAIVTVHDIGQDEASGTSFIAMEYVEGYNLKEVLTQGRPLSFETIGEVIAQVADALDFAHSKGIVHRDVKPANIILVDGNRAKITDFGIAKIASGAANLTTTGQFLGTPNYMAPEQIKGAAVDGRTDLFSLGICLYECLTRRKPFGGDSLTSISYKIVHEAFPPLMEVNPQIPEGFEEVVARALAKDPSKRYQRGKDMEAALRAVLRGESPAHAEPLLPDETLITNEREKLPTMEIPFPEAAEGDASGRENLSTRVAPTATRRNDPVIVSTTAETALRGPVSRRVHKTLSNVRAYPLWTRPIHPAVFFGISAIMVGALLGGIAAIRTRTPAIPRVDVQVELQRARERSLRLQGNNLLRQGRVADAYEKFVELNKLAPASPAVNSLLQRLASIRYQEEITRQQITNAQQKFDQGMALFNQKKFSDAAPLFEEAFKLNPNSAQAGAYLQLAQSEALKAEAAKKAARKQAITKVAGPTGPALIKAGSAAPGVSTVNNAPSQLTTSFSGPFTDGYIMVKAGNDVLAHQVLWEEKGRFVRRRTPRAINVTKEFPAKNADLQVWVIVPSQKINAHHVVQYNFKPGVTHHLRVTYDPKSKKFDFQLN